MFCTYKRVDDEMPVIQLPNTVQFGTPQGSIVIWAGTIATIPQGWALCDGLDGRPNLLDRFVRGVNTAVQNPGLTGGFAIVTLTVAQMASHTHSPTGSGDHDHTIPLGTGTGTTGVQLASGLDSGNALDLGDASPTIKEGTFTGSTGGGGSHDNIPPFFEVAYIIKTAN